MYSRSFTLDVMYRFAVTQFRRTESEQESFVTLLFQFAFSSYSYSPRRKEPDEVSARWLPCTTLQRMLYTRET